MAGEGTLTLQPQCSLDAENVRLDTKVIFSDKSELLIPKLDLKAWHDIQIEVENESNLTTNFETSKIDKLKNDIQTIQQNQVLIKPKSIELHDVHHYSLIYLLIISLST